MLDKMMNYTTQVMSLKVNYECSWYKLKQGVKLLG